METDRTYGRFYALLKKMPGADKETLVSQYTCGRTTHLSETTEQEYDTMCNGMARFTGEDEQRKAYIEHRKKMRSVCLKLMQQLGIDTTDWVRVNNFCENQRIAGKTFRFLSVEELVTLEKKLRAIKSRGGLKPFKEPEQKTSPALCTIVFTPKTFGQA